MSREKQIDEMARDLAWNICWDEDEIPTINCLETATRLYIKGYRKQSKGEWVKSDETTEQYGYLYMCSYCGGLSFLGKFCPNCGAKMKGESNE